MSEFCEISHKERESARRAGGGGDNPGCGNTAAHIAAASGHVDVLMELLGKNPEVVFQQNTDGNDVIMVAMMCNRLL